MSRYPLIPAAFVTLIVVVTCRPLSDESLAEGAISRASFDLQCPRNQIELTELSKGADYKVNSYGATGCGKRSVYVRARQSTAWILNSDSPLGEGSRQLMAAPPDLAP